MKILFDYQAFQLQKFGGISRYFFELIHDLHLADQNVHWELPIKYSVNEYLKQMSLYEGKLQEIPAFTKKNDEFKEAFWGINFRGKRKLYKLKEKLFRTSKPIHIPQPDYIHYNKYLSVEALKRGEYDIFHPTFYDDYFLEYIGNTPYVLTVYDLIHQIFPEYFLGNMNYADKSRNLLEGASHIIAISESTKKDLMMIYGIASEKITVTYLASSLTSSIAKATHYLPSLPKRYLLFIGHRITYKNFYFFIQAICPLLLKDKNLYVVCTGPGFSDVEKVYLNELGISDKVIHLYADDATLVHVYRNAIAFIFPSLYEGFGLPVLEAFTCGCPVAVSKTSSLPEVGGEAVIYFEPKNAESILDAVSTLVYEKKIRQEKIDAGYEQLKKFSWKKTVEDTVAVYKKVVMSHTVD